MNNTPHPTHSTREFAHRPTPSIRYPFFIHGNVSHVYISYVDRIPHPYTHISHRTLENCLAASPRRQREQSKAISKLKGNLYFSVLCIAVYKCLYMANVDNRCTKKGWIRFLVVVANSFHMSYVYNINLKLSSVGH